MTDYVVDFTDPIKIAFVIKPYTSNGPADPGQHTNAPLYTNAATANTSLVLFGQGDFDYGEVFAKNLVRVLENFAAPVTPAYAIQGQLWYNNTSHILSVFDGTSTWTPFEYSTNKTNDGTLVANSDTLYPTEQAVKTYADTKAPISSPSLTGIPLAPTAATSTNTTQLATTAFVQAVASLLVTGVSSFNSRTGAIVLNSSDVNTALGYTPANLVSPIFTGTPLAPTATHGNNTTQMATTAFVQDAVSTAIVAVSSFNSRTGAITLTATDINIALGYTPVNNISPAFGGIPEAPTASFGTSTSQIATTSFVQTAVSSLAIVSSFNARSGAVTTISSDVTSALGYTPVNPASASITGGTIDGTIIGSLAPSSATVTTLQINSTISINSNLIVSSTAPATISGFGTSPTILANNTVGFSITVGTGGTDSTGIITMPTATNGWICNATDITSNSSFITSQSAGSTTSITLTNYSRTTGTVMAWNPGDVLYITCVAY